MLAARGIAEGIVKSMSPLDMKAEDEEPVVVKPVMGEGL